MPVRVLPGHGPDLRRFVVAVWLQVRDERDLNVDRARLRLEGDLQLQAVEQRPKLWLGQVPEAARREAAAGRARW